jgi:hypothetical protein
VNTETQDMTNDAAVESSSTAASLNQTKKLNRLWGGMLKKI